MKVGIRLLSLNCLLKKNLRDDDSSAAAEEQSQCESDRDRSGTSSSLTRGRKQFGKVSISLPLGIVTTPTFSTRNFRMLKARRLPRALSSRRPTICRQASSYHSPSQEPRPAQLMAGRRRTGSGTGERRREDGWKRLNADKLCTSVAGLC